MSALDIKEKQILVRYNGDPNFTWHHRILLVRLSAGRWVVLTPTGSLQILDTTTVRFEPLARGRPVQDRCRNDCFLFDPLPVSELNEFSARARVLADIAGEDIEEDDAEVWVVCDPAHSRFGEQVEPGILVDAGRALLRETKGVVQLNANDAGSEVHVERVDRNDLADWKSRVGGGESDAAEGKGAGS